MRYLLAKNPKYITKVLQITLRVIDGFYKKQGVHFHVLVPDGVFHKTQDLSELFMRTKGPSDQDFKDLVQVLAKRIFAYFKRQGLTDGMSDHLNEDHWVQEQVKKFGAWVKLWITLMSRHSLEPSALQDEDSLSRRHHSFAF